MEDRFDGLHKQDSLYFQRKDPLVEYIKSLHVVDDIHYVSSDVLEKRILDTVTNVDYSQIINDSTRALFFGEKHDELEPKFEIVRSLAILKEMGYTAVAMEPVGIDKQDLLSRYLELGSSSDYDELLAYLKKVCGSYYGNQVAWSYMGILESARYSKLGGVAIGTVFQDVEPNDEFVLQNRDERLTSPLLKYLGENIDNKAIVVTGGAHASKTFSNNMVGILQTNGIGTQSVELLGEENLEPDDYVKAIHNVGLSRKRVMIPNPGAISVLIKSPVSIPVSFDYLVHVPHPEERM